MDKWVGWMAAILCPLIIGWNAYDLGREMGRREAVGAMRCNTLSAYHFVDIRTGKCALRTRP